MRPQSPLSLLILSTLEPERAPLTKYAVMIKVNHIAGAVDSPYSPGAVYHALEKLAKENMININHNMVRIADSGIGALHQILTQDPLPSSWLGQIYRIIACHICHEPKTRQEGLRRIAIEMIKNNQIGDTAQSSGDASAAAEQALISCRKYLGEAASKIISELGAIK